MKFLKFKEFMESYREQKVLDKNTALFFDENKESFLFTFYEDSYTVIDKKSIFEFAKKHFVGQEQAIEDFKKEYLDEAYKTIISEGEDIIDESKTYETFMEETINKMQKVVLSSIKDIDMNKTFGQFLKNLFNIVNSKTFLVKLRRTIKNSMSQGIGSAEEEIGVQVGWSNRLDNQLTIFESQQLNGYTINGTPWYGIKGATKEMQQQILSQVNESLSAGETRAELTNKIQDLFEGSSLSQAKRIARTETTRFINESKMSTYKESGLEGRKAYAAVMDGKTSEVCARLHDEYFEKGVGFDEPFIDPVTSKAYQYPPAHPNCRCTIEYRTPSEE